jgi:hypothetical protein
MRIFSLKIGRERKRRKDLFSAVRKRRDKKTDRLSLKAESAHRDGEEVSLIMFAQPVL